MTTEPPEGTDSHFTSNGTPEERISPPFGALTWIAGFRMSNGELSPFTAGSSSSEIRMIACGLVSEGG